MTYFSNYEVLEYLSQEGMKSTALILAIEKGHTEVVKILVEQEGIDINAKDKNEIYFNNFILQNNIWKFFKLFWTTIMFASNKQITFA